MLNHVLHFNTKLIQPWIVQFYLRKSVPGYTNSTWLTVGVGKIVPDLNTIDITIGIWYDFLADRLLFWHYLDINPEIIGHNHLFYRNTDKYRTFYLNKIQDQINSNRMGFRNGNIFRLFRLLQFIDRSIFGEKPAVAHFRSICLFAPSWPHLTVRWKAVDYVRNYENPNIF